VTKKVTISVPDDLYEKMETWRDEFNFSRIFQDAIGKAIGEKERFRARLKEDPDMKKVLARLRKEKAESEEMAEREKSQKAQANQTAFEAGKREGLDWAKAAHYDVISRAAKMIRDSARGKYPISPYQIMNLTAKGEVRQVEIVPIDLGVGTPQWEAEWLEGVEEFWREVEDKL
jgi:hypothetical protein